MLKILFRFLGLDVYYLHNSSRIGHVCAEVEHACKAHSLYHKNKRLVLLVNGENIANRYLFKLLKRDNHIVIELNSQDCNKILKLKDKFRDLPIKVTYDFVDQGKEKLRLFSQPSIQILKIPKKDEDRGKRLLENLNIPPDSWFVCLHNREPNFRPDLPYHSYRDCEIESFMGAVELIGSNGGYVVRIGDPLMSKTPEHPRLVDYAHSSFYSDFADIFLMSNCAFFLGNSSGPAALARICNRSICSTNIIPLTAEPINCGPLLIPKLLFCKRRERLLTFSEIVGETKEFFRTENYKDSQLEIIDSSQEDIREVVLEMIEIRENIAAYNEEDAILQSKFNEAFFQNGVPRRSNARVGRSFIRKYKHLA